MDQIRQKLTDELFTLTMLEARTHASLAASTTPPPSGPVV